MASSNSITQQHETEDLVNTRRFRIWLVVIVCFFALVFSFTFIAIRKFPNLFDFKIDQKKDTAIESSYKVDRVVDGDTIEVSQNGVSFKGRYIGVNTPETVKPNSKVECFGKEASAYNKSLIEGKVVELEKDVSEKDSFGRLLRYVYYFDDNSNKVMINKKLVDEGYAYASTYPPDVKYQEVFRASESNAREKGLGLWKSCPAK